MAKQRKIDQRFAIPCRHCCGRGQIELSGVYRDTVNVMIYGEELNGSQWAEVAGCNATTMNNRLARLVELGFVSVRPYGRAKLFRVKLDSGR